MRISVIGTGYVGSVTAACFAELGHQVICVDIDPAKVDMINRGVPPIYEEGLGDLLKKHAGNSLRATSDYGDAVQSSEVSFICVGTPSDSQGKIDTSIVAEAARSLASALRDREGYHVVVVKSTVVPGTTENLVGGIIARECEDFGLAMNPEFLREGKAVYDFMHPDKIVVGSQDKRAGDLVAKLYSGIDCPVTRTDIKTAEMIKYANNAFLAAKISFANEIGNICKNLGIDTYTVMEAIGRDSRINPRFLNSGVGFGGSCFPKDVKALIGKARETGYQPHLLEAIIKVNEGQPQRMTQLLKRKLGSLSGKRVAVLGLAFKNDTDDIRESRAIPVIRHLKEEGAVIAAYDPMATENMKKIFPDLEYAESPEQALKGAEACLIVTEWDTFRNLDFSGMKRKLVIDGRHIITPTPEIEYEGLCW